MHELHLEVAGAEGAVHTYQPAQKARGQTPQSAELANSTLQTAPAIVSADAAAPAPAPQTQAGSVPAPSLSSGRPLPGVPGAVLFPPTGSGAPWTVQLPNGTIMPVPLDKLQQGTTSTTPPPQVQHHPLKPQQQQQQQQQPEQHLLGQQVGLSSSTMPGPANPPGLLQQQRHSGQPHNNLSLQGLQALQFLQGLTTLQLPRPHQQPQQQPPTTTSLQGLQALQILQGLPYLQNQHWPHQQQQQPAPQLSVEEQRQRLQRSVQQALLLQQQQAQAHQAQHRQRQLEDAARRAQLEAEAAAKAKTQEERRLQQERVAQQCMQVQARLQQLLQQQGLQHQQRQQQQGTEQQAVGQQGSERQGQQELELEQQAQQGSEGQEQQQTAGGQPQPQGLQQPQEQPQEQQLPQHQPIEALNAEALSEQIAQLQQQLVQLKAQQQLLSVGMDDAEPPGELPVKRRPGRPRKSKPVEEVGPDLAEGQQGAGGEKQQVQQQPPPQQRQQQVQGRQASPQRQVQQQRPPQQQHQQEGPEVTDKPVHAKKAGKGGGKTKPKGEKLPPKQHAAVPTSRSHDPRQWLGSERDSLRRAFLLFGVGRWDLVHKGLLGFHKNCEKTPEEATDACWHLLQALEAFVQVPEDKTFLQQLLLPVADRGPITTPGFHWNKLHGKMVSRLRVLEEIRQSMEALQQPNVFGCFMTTIAALPPSQLPASWWSIKSDLGLLYGCWKHGYANYEEIRKDPEFIHVFGITPSTPAGDDVTENGPDTQQQDDQQRQGQQQGQQDELEQQPQLNEQQQQQPQQQGLQNKQQQPAAKHIQAAAGDPDPFQPLTEQSMAEAHAAAAAPSEDQPQPLQAVDRPAASTPAQLSAASAPSSEQLTKRYRRLLDCISKAQKVMGQDAKKAAQEQAAAAAKAARDVEDTEATEEDEKMEGEGDGAADEVDGGGKGPRPGGSGRAKGPLTAGKPAVPKAPKPVVIYRDDIEMEGGAEEDAEADFVGVETQSKRQAAKKASKAWMVLGHGCQEKKKGKGKRRADEMSEDEEAGGATIGVKEAGAGQGKKQRVSGTGGAKSRNQPDMLLRKHKLDVLKALMLWGLPPHIDLTAGQPSQAAAAGQPTREPPCCKTEPAARPAQGDAPPPPLQLPLQQPLSMPAAGAPAPGEQQSTQQAQPLPNAAPAGPVVQCTAASGAQMLLRALELPDRVLQTIGQLPPSRAWASAESSMGVWEKMRHSFNSLREKSNAALHGSVLELLALMHQLEEESKRKKPGPKEGPDGVRQRGSYGTHQPNCPCAVCVARRKKREAQEAKIDGAIKSPQPSVPLDNEAGGDKEGGGSREGTAAASPTARPSHSGPAQEEGPGHPETAVPADQGVGAAVQAARPDCLSTPTTGGPCAGTAAAQTAERGGTNVPGTGCEGDDEDDDATEDDEPPRAHNVPVRQPSTAPAGHAVLQPRASAVSVGGPQEHQEPQYQLQHVQRPLQGDEQQQQQQGPPHEQQHSEHNQHHHQQQHGQPEDGQQGGSHMQGHPANSATESEATQDAPPPHSTLPPGKDEATSSPTVAAAMPPLSGIIACGAPDAPQAFAPSPQAPSSLGPSSEQPASVAAGAHTHHQGAPANTQAHTKAHAQRGSGGPAPAPQLPISEQPPLVPTTATKLRERLVLLSALHAGHELLKSNWVDQCGLPKRVMDMPSWWEPEHDMCLVAGVLAHGCGEWNAILEDGTAIFKSSQEAYVQRQRLRRVAMLENQRHKRDEEQQQEEGPEDVAAGQAALTEETIQSTAAMPSPAVLFKRCRQISTVMLKLLRKGRNLKDEFAYLKSEQPKSAKGGGEVKKGGKAAKTEEEDLELKARAKAIAMEALLHAHAPSQKQEEDAATETDSEVEPDAEAADGVGNNGEDTEAIAAEAKSKESKARAKPKAAPPPPPPPSSEAWKIALEVLAGAGGGAKPSTSKGSSAAVIEEGTEGMDTQHPSDELTDIDEGGGDGGGSEAAAGNQRSRPSSTQARAGGASQGSKTMSLQERKEAAAAQPVARQALPQPQQEEGAQRSKRKAAASGGGGKKQSQGKKGEGRGRGRGSSKAGEGDEATEAEPARPLTLAERKAAVAAKHAASEEARGVREGADAAPHIQPELRPYASTAAASASKPPRKRARTSAPAVASELPSASAGPAKARSIPPKPPQPPMPPQPPPPAPTHNQVPAGPANEAAQGNKAGPPMPPQPPPLPAKKGNKRSRAPATVGPADPSAAVPNSTVAPAPEAAAPSSAARRRPASSNKRARMPKAAAANGPEASTAQAVSAIHAEGSIAMEPPAPDVADQGVVQAGKADNASVPAADVAEQTSAQAADVNAVSLATAAEDVAAKQGGSAIRTEAIAAEPAAQANDAAVAHGDQQQGSGASNGGDAVEEQQHGAQNSGVTDLSGDQLEGSKGGKSKSVARGKGGAGSSRKKGCEGSK